MISKGTALRLTRSGHANGYTIDKMLRAKDFKRLDKYLTECRAKANREWMEDYKQWERKYDAEFRPDLLNILPAYMRSLFTTCGGDAEAVKVHIRQQAEFWNHYNVTEQVNETFKKIRNEHA